MSDTDAQTLKQAADAVLEIDMKYRILPSIDDKEALKPARDEAFSNYTAMRLKLLEEGVITAPRDVEDMKEIRAEIEKAAQTQTLISAAGKAAVFFAKIARAGI